MKVDKINFILEIFNNDKHTFWANKGGPGSNLKRIKYSNEDLFIIDVILLEYLL